MKLDKIIRVADVLEALGIGRSKFYKLIRDGLWTRSIPIAGSTKGWPASEVAALNAYRIAGKSEDEIRTRVAQLEAARKTAAEEVDAILRKGTPGKP